MQRPKETMDGTDNSKIYIHSRKHYLANRGLVKCTFCKYHKWENASKSQRSWKKSRKKKYR